MPSHLSIKWGCIGWRGKTKARSGSVIERAMGLSGLGKLQLVRVLYLLLCAFDAAASTLLFIRIGDGNPKENIISQVLSWKTFSSMDIYSCFKVATSAVSNTNAYCCCTWLVVNTPSLFTTALRLTNYEYWKFWAVTWTPRSFWLGRGGSGKQSWLEVFYCKCHNYGFPIL